jgi:hypothetical protein
MESPAGIFRSALIRKSAVVFLSQFPTPDGSSDVCSGPFPESLQTKKFRRLELISGLNSARKSKGFPHENHF